MKYKIKKIATLLWLSLTFACGQEKSSYFDVILQSKTGVFRGVELGDNINKIKSVEDPQYLIDNMAEYLHYDYPLDMGNSYTISYDFSNKNLLYEIEMAAYFDVIADANNLFTSFNDYFNQKYGKGEITEDGYMSWKTTSQKMGHHIQISMINDSRTYGYVSILIRDLDY